MKISVLGCGRWGTFLAWYCCKQNNDVILYGRENSKNLAKLKKTRKNEYLKIQDNLELTSDLQKAILSSDLIIISISAQELRAFAGKIAKYDIKDKIFILNMKGLEADTGKRLSVVFKETINKPVKVAVWLGPGHVQDFVKDIPNCMIIGSEDIEITKFIVENLKSKVIRFYYAQDMIGNEVGAAAKNVMGIAAGFLDGVGKSSLKGALMTRGSREISRLIKAMGGNEFTAYGLSHLGDYEATLFSKHSNNRKFGEKFAKNEKFEKLAEGVYTIKALNKLSKLYNVELPISNALYEIIFEKKNIHGILDKLFERETKFEF